MKKFWMGLCIGAVTAMVLSLGGFLWYLRLAGDPPRPGEASFSLEMSSPPEQVVAGETFDVTLSMQNRSPFAYVLGTNGRPFGLLFYKEGERESYAEELVPSTLVRQRHTPIPAFRRRQGPMWWRRGWILTMTVKICAWANKPIG